MSEAASRHRRRGEELETALLDAAWQELAETGFGKMTMESVAARARTGVAVLYRRWSGKDDLAVAAIAHYGKNHPIEAVDTGSMRGDLMALLGGINEGRASYIVVVTAAFAGLIASTGLPPAEVRARIVSDRSSSPATFFQRAHDRGEIDLNKVPPAVLALPFDLVRHDLLLTLEPLSPERMAQIVDDLFLPLVALYSRG